MANKKTHNLIFLFLYIALFLLGIKALFHGFPDIERFFAEWMDERLTLTYIMKFGTLNFAPTEIWHPPLYHYFTFIPITAFFVFGKLIGLFHNKVEFVRFYFNNTHYFFFIGRMMSYLFFWVTAVVIFKIIRLFYGKIVAHITVLSFLLIPRFIFDFSTTRPETLLFLNTSIFLYCFLIYYLKSKEKYLLIAAFVLGLATATKYNALFLGSIFIPLLFFRLRTRAFANKALRESLSLCLKICFLVFLGFFIGNPFFVIRFETIYHNFIAYSLVEIRHYHTLSHQPFIFCLTHLKELLSFIYLNPFGLSLLVFGGWQLFRGDKKLMIMFCFTALVFELYFGVFQSVYSPLRYSNPLLPIAALIFGSGIDLVIRNKKRFAPVLIIFGLILLYNYFDVWRQFSFGPTYLQRARHFIEQSIPEFTTICITSKSHLPQLNMTRESYCRLINTAPVLESIPGHELDYREMDNEKNYDSIFRELRIESLMKEPQYNLLRWDKDIKAEKDAINFLKKNNVKYILGMDMPVISNKRLIDTGIVSLVKEFKSRNKRIYGSCALCLYKVN